MVNRLIHWAMTQFDWLTVGEALAAIGVTWLVGHYFVRWLFAKLVPRLGRWSLLANLVQALRGPAQWFVFASGWYLALYALHAPRFVFILGNRMVATIMMLSFGYALYQLMPHFMHLVDRAGNRLDVKVDNLVGPFLTHIGQACMVVLIFFIILSIWGINLSGLFAGVGLAGLAVSMAAQDQIRNLLGGFIIITERPFSIGDKIQSPSVFGIVEDITFRSTRLRTLDGTLLVVPNATLANEPITDISRVKIPRANVTFTLASDTTQPELDQLFKKMMAFLKQNWRFDDTKMAYQIMVTGLTVQGVAIQVIAPMSDRGADDFFGSTTDLNIALLDLIEELGIKLAAYPAIADK
ncbi:mechanosensitive ion channel family protein [Weissella halotolerans]|nr:mechanosensitive ion channel family protein [Weissella halotolerans]